MTIDENQKEPKSALMIGISAFLLWGFMPAFIRQMNDVSPWVITANRILWTTPWALGLALIFHGANRIKIDLKSFGYLTISALMIGSNWTIFAWAVSQNHIMETALGYFINPLINVVFAMLIFGEKLDKWKILALFIATIAVINQAVMAHHVPIIGIALALLFSGYGIVRKKVAVPPATGLFWESLALAPFAAIGLYFLAKHGVSPIGNTKPDHFWLLLTGPATAAPLILYAFGARNLKFSTLAMLQYIGPTISFFISLAYGEAFTINHAVTFSLIWLALGVYTWADMKKDK